MFNASNFPVMPAKCPTCPFRVDENGRYPDPYLVGEIQARCISEASQICHHPRLDSKPETHLCRGARNYQLQIFHRLGVIEEPTDEAWDKAWNQIKKKSYA